MKWYYKLMLALGFVMVVTLFAIAIAWPFLWKMVFKEAPPTDITTFSSLITIVLSLLALGVAAFSILIYYTLREFLRRELRSDIERRFNLALAHSETSVVYGFWRMWRNERGDTGLLETAINLQERALERINDIKLEELSEEYKKMIYQAKSNLAGYIVCKSSCLGSKVNPADVNKARKVGKEAYDKSDELGDEYDWKANYAAVLKAFGTEFQKGEAQKIIKQIQERHKNKEITDDEMKEYNELWGFTRT